MTTTDIVDWKSPEEWKRLYPGFTFSIMNLDEWVDDRKRKIMTSELFYHVTRTSAVQSIKEKGIIQTFKSNWKKGTGERYGEGEIFAFTSLLDAVRWAAKMDWEFYHDTGSGKISIVAFRPTKDQQWVEDTSDPLSQAMAKGKWVKLMGRVAPERILPITVDLTRELASKSNKGRKLMRRGKKTIKAAEIEARIRRHLEWSWNFGLAEDMQEETTKGIARLISDGINRGEDQTLSDLIGDFINLRVTDGEIDPEWLLPDHPEDNPRLRDVIKTQIEERGSDEE